MHVSKNDIRTMNTDYKLLKLAQTLTKNFHSNIIRTICFHSEKDASYFEITDGEQKISLTCLTLHIFLAMKGSYSISCRNTSSEIKALNGYSHIPGTFKGMISHGDKKLTILTDESVYECEKDCISKGTLNEFLHIQECSGPKTTTEEKPTNIETTTLITQVPF